MDYRDDILPGWAEELIQNLRDQVQELQAALFIADMELAEERERNGVVTPDREQPAATAPAPHGSAGATVSRLSRRQRPQLRLIQGHG